MFIRFLLLQLQNWSLKWNSKLRFCRVNGHNGNVISTVSKEFISGFSRWNILIGLRKIFHLHCMRLGHIEEDLHLSNGGSGVNPITKKAKCESRQSRMTSRMKNETINVNITRIMTKFRHFQKFRVPLSQIPNFRTVTYSAVTSKLLILL